VPKPDSTLVGVSGEYFVAAELSRRGRIASMTLKNTRGVDILASNWEGTKQVGIQVKTSQHGRPEWILNEKAERYCGDNLFYAFVCLKDSTERPDFYIVPSSGVADYVRKSHRKWLRTPGKKGQPHVDTPMRKFVDLKGIYLERWELLGI